MGADLCLETAECIRDISKPDKIKKDMLKYLNVMPFKKDDWLEFMGRCGCKMGGVKEEAIKAIDIFFEILSGARDVTILDYPERKVVVSGGMSWGDEPTQEYSLIGNFNSLPIDLLNAGGFFVKEEPVDTFLRLSGKDLPKQLKKKLEDWRIQEKVMEAL